MIKNFQFILIKLFLSAFLILSHALQSQTFIELSQDTSGDQTETLSPDAKSIGYAIDRSKDSFWIQMTFHNSISSSEWNVKIGLDINSDVTNGGVWQGSNTAMKFDVLFDVYHTPGFPYPITKNIVDSNDTYISSNLEVIILDSTTLNIGFKMSEVIGTAKELNLIAGCGIVLGSINDDIPDQGALNVDLKSNSLREVNNKGGIQIFPNPASNVLNIKSDQIESKFTIRNALGKEMFKGVTRNNNENLDISTWPLGLYFIQIEHTEFSQTLHFFKQ